MLELEKLNKNLQEQWPNDKGKAPKVIGELVHTNNIYGDARINFRILVDENTKDKEETYRVAAKILGLMC